MIRGQLAVGLMSRSPTRGANVALKRKPEGPSPKGVAEPLRERSEGRAAFIRWHLQPKV